MTRVVALDTSTWWGSFALVESSGSSGPAVVAELAVDVRGSHADRVLRRIELLLAEAGWDKSSVDLYAATRGPGSFTGIRVGLGTIRGLSLATGRPAVGETTLAALAEAHGPAEHDRLTLMEAGRAELYGARFDAASSPPAALESPWLSSRARLSDGAPCVVVPGPGTELDADELPYAAKLSRPPRGIAAAVGRLVALRDRRAITQEKLAPLYIRPPDAILKRHRS